MNKVHISISVTVISIIVAATLLILSIVAFNLPAAQAATTGTLTITSNTVLAEDHHGNIIIAADNITLDGNGHTVTGNNSGIGVSLANRSDVTVKNLKVKNFTTGISLIYSNNSTLTHNTVSNNIEGIGLYYSDCDLTDNIVSNNGGGISLNQSGCGFNNNTISNNNGTGISLFRSGGGFTGNIVSNNNERGISLNESPSTLTNNVVTNNYDGIYLLYSYATGYNLIGNIVSNNRHDGIVIWGHSGSTLVNNTVFSNAENGIFVQGSNDNTLNSNNVFNNTENGIYLYQSRSNTLTGNTISNNNHDGIRIWSSDYNTLKDNVVSNNNIGILLHGSNNTLTNNNVSNNNYGVWLLFSSYSKIYHNNFISNPTQVYFEDRGLGDIFNLPLPIGGNYWSNYDTPAEGCTDTNNNGFCDAPYVFSGGNDSLPWTRMNGWLKPGVITLTFQGYDYDNQDEVSILVNNQQVAVLPTTYSPHNNNLFANYALDISEYVVVGMNTLTFKQNIYSSGVRNLVIENSSTATTTTLYSNSTNYNLWIGGRESVTYSFSTSPFTLAFQGYDYNNRGEVSILVNDQVAYTLPTSYSPHNVKTYASYTLDISKYIVPGNSNTITFKQNMYSSAVKEVQVTHLGSIIYSNSTRFSIWIGGRESVTYTRD